MLACVAERWASISDHPNYEVSDQGRVRSLGTKGHPGRILNGSVGKYGHIRVRLRTNGSTQRHFVHVLVMSAFAGPRPAGLQVRHLDGRAGNNSLSNLKYGTARENQLDSIEHGTHWQLLKNECPKGHEYDEDNTYTNGTKRYCRRCHAESEATRRASRSRS